jgi:hypothetical protein
MSCGSPRVSALAASSLKVIGCAPVVVVTRVIAMAQRT